MPQVKEATPAGELLPARVAALQAHISRERMTRLVQVGQVKGVLVGGRYHVDPTSLAAWMAGRQSEPQPAA